MFCRVMYRVAIWGCWAFGSPLVRPAAGLLLPFFRTPSCSDHSVCPTEAKPRYNYVGLFVVISFVLVGKGTCLCPRMVRTTSITGVMLRISSIIKLTRILLNNKNTPALSTSIKPTHVINLPHGFTTYILPCFET